MKHRFHVPGLPGSSNRAVVDGAEARHLMGVVRLGPGDEVELFDGEGRAARAEILGGSKREVELAILEWREDPPAEGPEIVLATAVPKGDRYRSLVEKATELGVDRLIPLRTRHSVVHPGDGKQNKMRHAVIGACKQSGRNRLMTLDTMISWDELLSDGGQDLVIGQRGGAAAAAVVAERCANPRTQRIVLCVGPEGGWTDAETDAARQAGAHLVGLGEHVLRIETAGVALASLVASQRSADQAG